MEAGSHDREPGDSCRWHRSGFAIYWRAISRGHRIVGRRRISKELRDLIFRMVAENSTWGTPRIHGEFLMLGFDISERTISRWRKRAPRDPEPARRWLAFVGNQRPTRGLSHLCEQFPQRILRYERAGAVAQPMYIVVRYYGSSSMKRSTRMRIFW
jgi:hypothetical protein